MMANNLGLLEHHASLQRINNAIPEYSLFIPNERALYKEGSFCELE